MHVIANRIGFDKKTVSDSNNYQKTASFFRKMELKFNLRQVLKYKHQTGLFIHRLKVK